MVVSSDTKNLNLAQQLAADREQWLQEANRLPPKESISQHYISIQAKYYRSTTTNFCSAT